MKLPIFVLVVLLVGGVVWMYNVYSTCPHTNFAECL
jgi:hypothetical protein